MDGFAAELAFDILARPELFLQIQRIQCRLKENDITPNPPLTEAEVQAFEQKHGVRLPDGYRHFLLYIGNGIDGAGNDWLDTGILPLPLSGPAPTDKRQQNSLWGALEHIAEPFTLTDGWGLQGICGEPHEGEEELEDLISPDEYQQECDEITKAMVPGSLPIMEDWSRKESCLFLAVTGENPGCVWEFKDSLYQDMSFYVGVGPETDFLTWLETQL